MLSHLTMWRTALETDGFLERQEIGRNLRAYVANTLAAAQETQQLRDALNAAAIATRRWLHSEDEYMKCDDSLHVEAIRKLDQAFALAEAAGPSASSRALGIG